MKYKSRRLNAVNETGKQFYRRRKKAMDDWCDQSGQWQKKIWQEYRKANEETGGK